MVVLVVHGTPAPGDPHQNQDMQMNLGTIKVATLDALCIFRGCSITQNLLPPLVFRFALRFLGI